MALETTLILCKPDAVSRQLVGEILSRIERRGYVITAMRMMQITGDKAREHYAEHKDKPFFQGLVDFITSGPLVALAVEGENAIDGMRQIIGATNPLSSAPGSIRGDFGQTVEFNLVHGSDSKGSAERELKIFFHANEFVSRKHDLAKWLAD
jgi:nucleoside-diphosphate kinase